MAKQKNNNTKKTNPKKQPKKTEKWIPIISLIFSLLALFITYSQYKLSAQQDDESKIAIWSGKYDESNQNLSIVSNDNQINIQHGTVFFPSNLDLNPTYISPPDFKFSTITLETAISKYVDLKYSRSNDSIKDVQSDIPIIINSNYTAKGNIRQISSSYTINYIATLPQNDVEPPTVEIQGIWFSHHVPTREKDVQFYLDLYWDGVYNLHKP